MKILMAYNATESNKTDLMTGLKLAKAFQAEMIVLTSLMIGDKGHSFDSRVKEEALVNLSEVKRIVEETGIACKTELLIRGNQPGDDIVQYAKENQVDFIVVGVKKRSRVGKLLLGSTTQYVVLNAPCPVLSFKELTKS